MTKLNKVRITAILATLVLCLTVYNTMSPTDESQLRTLVFENAYENCVNGPTKIKGMREYCRCSAKRYARLPLDRIIHMEKLSKEELVGDKDLITIAMSCSRYLGK